MKILFTFENPLPSREADAEVFITTAKHLAAWTSRSWLHVPVSDNADCEAARSLAGMPVIPAHAPRGPAPLRHLCCGLTMVVRQEFREADLVYTRNLWVAWLAVLFGQRVVFDHYRPWPAQIPPLQPWIYRLVCNRHLLVNITHSEYTRARYLEIGVPRNKVYCIRNGFEPQRLEAAVPVEVAKQNLGIDADSRTVVYTGRVNRRKGLQLVVEAAKRLPDHLFILVGSYGDGAIEALANGVSNIRIVPWQQPEALGRYVFAADVLLIPPSLEPLVEFGSTVLPLKLFFYMASGRPILAGDTPDVREVLQHGRNALLCRPDCLDSLVAGISALTSEKEFAQRLSGAALADGRDFTWSARAHKISALVRGRMAAVARGRGTWGRAQYSTWVRQSWRWAIHLVRMRSWVLPPRVAFSAPYLPRTGQKPLADNPPA